MQRSLLQIAVRTSHTVVGMLLLMTSVILLFRVLRVASTLAALRHRRPIERPLPRRLAGLASLRRGPLMTTGRSASAYVPVEAIRSDRLALSARMADYLELAKPRIAAMVLLTVTVGFTAGQRRSLDVGKARQLRWPASAWSRRPAERSTS